MDIMDIIENDLVNYRCGNREILVSYWKKQLNVEQSPRGGGIPNDKNYLTKIRKLNILILRRMEWVHTIN